MRDQFHKLCVPAPDQTELLLWLKQISSGKFAAQPHEAAELSG